MNAVDPVLDPLYTFTNEETAMQSRIWARRDGQYSVTLTDLDSHVTLPTVTIIPTIAHAIDHARAIADLDNMPQVA